MIELSVILALVGGGFAAGIVAGLMGVGGGTLMVPILVALGASPVQAVATSGLAILVTSISGTVQNFRMGVLRPSKILALGIPSLLTAQLGVILASALAPDVLLWAFAGLLLVNIPLMSWGNALRKKAPADQVAIESRPSQIGTGTLAGFLAGLFGIGGGVIMVPLQILLLKEPIKTAIQTSLAVIVLTSIAATAGHAWHGNVLPLWGVILGLGGLVGAQISTRYLPKLSDRVVHICFRSTLLVLFAFIAYKAWVY